MNSEKYIELLTTRYPILQCCKESITEAVSILIDCFSSGKKLLLAGNGGSCADCDHIVGELMKSFKLNRHIDDELREKIFKIDNSFKNEKIDMLQQGLPAISLTAHNSLNTAFLNDVDGGSDLIFAQQVLGYGVKGDVFLGISTSGNSKNIYNACLIAKAKGLKTIALSGRDGGALAKIADVSIIAPLDETYMIQELHLPIYHCICLILEDYFFNK